MKFPSFLPHYSPKRILCASLLLAFAWLPQAARAESYEVDSVVVDAEGKDTTDARTKALALGEKDAFAQLMLRLNPVSAPAILGKVTHAQVSAAVRGYSVLDEKMSATHYHATLNYTFYPGPIQALLPNAAAPVPNATAAAAPATAPAPVPAVAAAPPSKAVLVLPVYNRGDALELWQDDNKWRNVWYEAALESGGGMTVVPLGDMHDRIDVDDGNVNAATADSLKHMYPRYGVGQIAILSAYFNPKADPKPALEVTVKKLNPNGPPAVSQVSYTIHLTETLDMLLTRAAGDIAHRIYLEQTIDPSRIENDRVKEINARINTTDIKEWQALRKHLLMRSNIVDIRFVSISYYETSMVISYKGTQDMLGKTLVASGLRVLEDQNGFVLSLK